MGNSALNSCQYPIDGVYPLTVGAPTFHAVPAATLDELENLLASVIRRTLKVLTRKVILFEQDPHSLYLADTDRDCALVPPLRRHLIRFHGIRVFNSALREVARN